MVFLSFQDSSLFQNWLWNFSIFHDYVIAGYVIGHDVIGQSVMESENSGLGLFIIENRLVIDGLDKKYWPI